MARYRQTDIRMWGDEKFRRLSKPQPCGQVLWYWLLTGPETRIIPGVLVTGPAAMAEALRWPIGALPKDFPEALPKGFPIGLPEGFLGAFAEVVREGMAKADFEARLVWIPKAIHYNKPQSPNVVRHWSDAWDEVPECPLKLEIWQTLKDYMEGLSKAYAEAFREALPKPSAKPYPNQEQEQEQEQEKIYVGQTSSARPPSTKQEAQAILAFLNEKAGRNYRLVDTNIKLVEARLKSGITPQQLRQVIARKCRDWGANPKMQDYLRPATLFGKEKCEQYVGELVPVTEVARDE